MNITLQEAAQEHLPLIQNMARFYAYDLSKSCGFYELFDWSFPESGLYECRDLSGYWKSDCYPFIIRVDGELAGFVIVDKKGTTADIDWNIVEFFVVGKFQGKGVGRQVALQIFNKFPGTWEVTQMPVNIPAIEFWKKVVNEYTNNNFSSTLKVFPDPTPHENIVLKFRTI